MALNGKLIGGLAWTGLVLVLAVPSADLVTSQFSARPAMSMTSDTDQVQTASIADPVEAYEQSGKPLPSYISDAPGVTAPAPTVKVLPPGGTTAPLTVNVPRAPQTPPAATEVAAIAPVPYPASMRPAPPIAAGPVPTGPVVVEDVAGIGPPPVGRPPASVGPGYVTEDDLADWNSGTLADYLERRGLIADAAYEDSSSAEYDGDGFFLDEGPNNSRTYRSRSRRDFEDDGYFFVFPD